MSQSLYRIQQDLESLAALRESAELEGDSEALKVIDQQIAEYLTKEAAKVTSYVGLIRCEELNAEACEKEAQRFLDIAKQKRALVARLKETALEVMNRFGVRELKATPGGGLRIQGNGGLQPLEIIDTDIWEKLPPTFINQHVHMTIAEWKEIGLWLGKYQGGLEMWHKLSAKLEYAPMTPAKDAIREALKRGEVIAGARLLPRGEHVRVL
jgi:hypothetical protein